MTVISSSFFFLYFYIIARFLIDRIAIPSPLLCNLKIFGRIGSSARYASSLSSRLQTKRACMAAYACVRMCICVCAI